MNDRLREAIEGLIADCQYIGEHGHMDMNREQLASCCGLQRAMWLIELRKAFRENYPD